MPLGKMCAFSDVWQALNLARKWTFCLLLVLCWPLLSPAPSWGDEGESLNGILGHVSAKVPSGGQFSPSQADILARAKAWLDGVEMTARVLAGMDAVRLAGLDFYQMQALAALLGGVETSPISSLKAQAKASPDFATLWPEASASVTLRVAKPDAASVSQALANVEAQAQWEELIIALRRLLPEALEWAERGHDLRVASQPAHPSADDIIAARLSLLASATGAALAYADFLSGAPLSPELQNTLDWAQGIVPPLAVARADMLLRQDRPQAALHILRDITPPPAVITPEKKMWIQSRSRAWSAVWTSAWPPHPSDERLYARSLYVRGLAQLRSGQPALAEADFSAALALEPQRPDFLLARGATYQVREIFDAMCRDYYLACTLGSCDGLASSREQKRCLPQ